MALKISKRKNVRIGRIISIITATAISLWVGSAILTSVAASMNHTEQIFMKGFELIGFGTCAAGTNCTAAADPVVMHAVMNGSISTTGILSVVGLVAFAAIVLEFIQIKF